MPAYIKVSLQGAASCLPLKGTKCILGKPALERASERLFVRSRLCTLKPELKNLHLKLADSEDKKQWDEYAEKQGNSLAYHLFAWKTAVEEAYGFYCPYFMAVQESRVAGVFPAVHVSIPFGRGKLVSLPYCDVGGVLAETREVSYALFDYACRYAGENNISAVEIRCSPELAPAASPYEIPINDNTSAPKTLNESAGKVRMLLKLPGSSDALLSSFKSKLRSQVRKPVRDGLYVQLGGAELLDYFYHVFSLNMKALGSPVHSRRWIESVLKFYGEKARCGVVFLPDKTPAAAGIILCHKRTVSIPWASSDPGLNRLNPNMLLYWSFLEFAADNGYSFFDFGRSTPGEGTYRFKEQWGAGPVPLIWKQWRAGKNGFVPEDIPAGFSGNGRARSTAENIIRKMPLSAAVYLGSRVRKYISL